MLPASRRPMAPAYTRRVRRSFSVFIQHQSNRLNASTSSTLSANTSPARATRTLDYQELGFPVPPLFGLSNVLDWRSTELEWNAGRGRRGCRGGRGGGENVK